MLCPDAPPLLKRIERSRGESVATINGCRPAGGHENIHQPRGPWGRIISSLFRSPRDEAGPDRVLVGSDCAMSSAKSSRVAGLWVGAASGRRKIRGVRVLSKGRQRRLACWHVFSPSADRPGNLPEKPFPTPESANPQWARRTPAASFTPSSRGGGTSRNAISMAQARFHKWANRS